MKAVAFILLSACATAPASLPWVRIDRSLEGAVCSREAAIAIVQARARERGEWLKEQIDCDARAELAERRASQAQWWQANAPWMIGIAGALGIAIGAAVGAATQR